MGVNGSYQSVQYPKWLLGAAALACVLVGFGGSFAVRLKTPEWQTSLLQAQVTQIAATQQRVLTDKADKAMVDAQYAALLRETADIKQMIRDHMSATRAR
jgi:hypothetical protein